MAVRQEAPTIVHRTGLDKFSFLIVFIFGASGILLFKVLFNFNQIYITSWPILWMVIYLLLVTVHSRFRLREDQAGDNLYYLGFLYTLTSLSVALYYFSDNTAALDYIISNFGIALSTTIVGVALRVVLHQMREDPIDLERESRHSLVDAVRRLQSELDSSVRDFNHFRRQIQQSVEESIQQTGDLANRLLRESGEQVTKSASTAAAGITSAFEALDSNAAQFHESASRLVASVEQLMVKVDSIETPRDLIEKKFGPAGDRLIQLADEIAHCTRIDNDAVTQLNISVATVSEATDRILANTESFTEASRANRALALTVNDLVDRITTNGELLTSSTESLAAAANAQATASRSQVENLQAQAQLIAQAEEALRDRLTSFHERLDRQVDSMAEKTSEAMETLVARNNELYRDFAKQVQETLSFLKSHRASIEEEVSSARKASEDVVSALSSMMRTLGEQLAADVRDR